MSEEKKNEILEEKLDTEELEAVNGGGAARGPGSCAKDFYVEPCKATVEKESWCHRNDFCSIWSETYNCKNPKAIQNDHKRRLK